jgi:hypothetical protein
MALSTTLQQYLADQKIAYEVITHRPTISSSVTAEASHVSGEGGDHTSLVQVSSEQFFWLTQNAAHGHFSTHD